ncbi:RNA methyltransferase [Erwinia sp. CPCC 100877]|nr:RNA methyltransferase [Erwinia sp. CPCC 100877]
MKEILSTKNTLIKELKKLNRKKYREESQRYIVEGFHLIEEAVKADADIEWLLVSQRGRREWAKWLAQQRPELLIAVSDEVLATLSELPTPQGMLAVVKMPAVTERQEFSGSWLLLDNVQDPGNVGTMIRTADAAGMTGVILGTGSADIYNTKVLRAMQGSNYHLPILQVPLEKAIEAFKQAGTPVYGTELNKDAVTYQKVAPIKNYALIMGNEGQGIHKDLLQLTDQNLYIPIKGQAESLNVAIAAGILMYHLSSVDGNNGL